MKLASAWLLAVAAASQIRDLRFSDINFLHTTDTHGWYSGHKNQPQYRADWGDFILFAHRMKEAANSRGQDLLLVDSGDRHDGNGLSDATAPNGAKALPIFMEQAYDVVTIGNHELYLWENSRQELDVLIPHFGEKYVCSNVEYLEDDKWHDLANRTRYFESEKQKKKILALSFLFDFNRNNKLTRVTPIDKVVHQDWFNELPEEFPEVDIVLVVGHIPVDRRWAELQLLHAKLRVLFPDSLIQYFGGHSHIRDFVVYDDKSTGLQSGRFCETVGFLSLNTTDVEITAPERYFRSYIDFNKESFLQHVGYEFVDHFNTKKGLQVSHDIVETRKELKLDEQLGTVETSNYYQDYVPISHPKNIYKLLTKQVLPTLKAEFDIPVSNERLIIINTGSVRYDLYKGPYTKDTQYIVLPFENEWLKVTLPKHVAIQIAPLLNRNGYIISELRILANDYLLPPHQLALRRSGGLAKRDQNVFQFVDLFTKRPSKGYVTHDDFGSDGDDTVHRPVINYAIPNVVQSIELDKKLGREAEIDVVFYSFLLPNVEEAVKTLNYQIPEPQLYSKKYLGLLLNDYVKTNQI